MNEEKINEVRDRVAGILGHRIDRVLFVERPAVLKSVYGECTQTGFITMTVDPRADPDLVVYATLHEVGHRRQFADGVNLTDYSKDVFRYELDAWTRADRWMAAAGTAKTIDMTAFAESCLSSYRTATQYASLEPWTEETTP